MASKQNWFCGFGTGCRLLRSPAELPAMVVALATGVGLTVTAYSLIHAVLLQPLPYSDPERLVQVWEVNPDRPGLRVLRDRDAEALATTPSPVQGIATHAVLQRHLLLGAGKAPVQLVGAHVSVDFFTVLGVQAATGRTFRPEDSQLTNISPIVVSERLVRSGLVSGRIGETVEFEGATHRLVGTMPVAFWFPDRETSFWAPVLVVPREQQGTGTNTNLSRTIARLPAGVTPAVAQAQANVRLARPEDSPGRPRHRVERHVSLLSAPVRPALMVLQAGSALVLLLVGLNVGWLFAARGRRLRPTFATMRSLGATAGQVLVTHFASAVCAAVLAAPCAVLIAWGLLQFLLVLEGGVFSDTAAPGITGHVATVALTVALVVGLVSCVPGGAAVAFHAGPLGDGERMVSRGRAGNVLAVAQASLVFALGAQAVLVALVLRSLVDTNVGFTKTDFLVVEMRPQSSATVDADVQLARYEALVERLGSQGIRAAAASSFPFTRSGHLSTFEPRRSRSHVRTMVRVRAVTPSYFQVTGMTTTRGRFFTGRDVGSSLIVVNDAFLAAVSPSATELGRRVGEDYSWTVVGVTHPVRQHSVHEETQAEAYVLFDDLLQRRSDTASLAMRGVNILAEMTHGAAATLQVIRTAVADLMPEFTIRSARPVTDLISNHLGRQRLVAVGTLVFAAVSLLLAALGLYARVGQSLALRGREIGIRMALGASVRCIAMESARPIGAVYTAGVCLGTLLLVAVMSATRAVVAPPPGGAYPSLWAIAGISALVLLVAFSTACYRPIRRATRTDPADSLRDD